MTNHFILFLQKYNPLFCGSKHKLIPREIQSDAPQTIGLYFLFGPVMPSTAILIIYNIYVMQYRKLRVSVRGTLRDADTCNLPIPLYIGYMNIIYSIYIREQRERGNAL